MCGCDLLAEEGVAAPLSNNALDRHLQVGKGLRGNTSRSADVCDLTTFLTTLPLQK
jgi:hypothetical protein